jgi:hypothetical protein
MFNTSSCAGWRGGVLTGGSAVARRWQGVVGDLERVTGKVPGRKESAGAHRNGGSMVRRRKRHRAAVFVGGEGAPVGGDGGCGVLQHRRGKGVRKLQEIAGIGSSGRSSPGSDGQRRCSAGIREGEWAAGGRRRRSECGERWGVSVARDEGSERSGDGRTSGAARGGASGSVAAQQRGKEEGKGGGPGMGVPRGVALTGGQRPAAARARRSWVTCTARALSAETERGERRLTGGPRHSAGRRCRWQTGLACQ